jgi:histone-lysine N-methyltransferase SETMAR
MLGRTLRSNSSRPHVIWLGTNESPPHYSPDLAPSDFNLFLHLKKFLAGQRFNNDEDVKRAVQKWLSSQAAMFYDNGIQKLVFHYDKCLSNGENYVEK